VLQLRDVSPRAAAVFRDGDGLKNDGSKLSRFFKEAWHLTWNLQCFLAEILRVTGRTHAELSPSDPSHDAISSHMSGLDLLDIQVL
jgi:hypothetical protein